MLTCSALRRAYSPLGAMTSSASFGAGLLALLVASCAADPYGGLDDEFGFAPNPPPPPGGGYICYDGTCYQKSTGTMTKAQCESKCSGPPPGPPPGGDSWETYTVAGMQVQSVVGGSNSSEYTKVVIMLNTPHQIKTRHVLGVE